MLLRNTHQGFGLVAILFHWIVTLMVIGLFTSGLWMTDLGYYDPWYNRAPDLHRCFGILLLLLLGLRLFWKLVNKTPVPERKQKRWAHVAASSVHWVMYLLLLSIIAAGYLLSTLDGRPIEVFDWFSIPPILTAGGQAGDLAGAVHYWLSMCLAGMVALHSLGALKHHFIDRDRTLVRMIRPVRGLGE